MIWKSSTSSSSGAVDTFEDGDLSEYKDQGTDPSPSGFTVVDSANGHPVWAGSKSLMADGNGNFNRIHSEPGEGLDNYFYKGNKLRYYFRTTAIENSWSLMFGTSSNENTYDLQFEFGNDDIDLVVIDSGTASILTSTQDGTLGLTADTWYETTITWDDGSLGGSDNDITLNIIDKSDDSVVWNPTVNDNTHQSSGGIGYGGLGANNPAYIDDLRLVG